jgi:AMP nucleosidase
VLAHAYLRDDHVLDDVLPPEIPIPALSPKCSRRWQLAAAPSPAMTGDTLKRACAPARS